jgi:hypothetical protein
MAVVRGRGSCSRDGGLMVVNMVKVLSIGKFQRSFNLEIFHIFYDQPHCRFNLLWSPLLLSLLLESMLLLSLWLPFQVQNFLSSAPSWIQIKGTSEIPFRREK